MLMLATCRMRVDDENPVILSRKLLASAQTDSRVYVRREVIRQIHNNAAENEAR